MEKQEPVVKTVNNLELLLQSFTKYADEQLTKNRFLIFVKGLIDNGLVGASAYTSYLGGAHYGGMAMDTVRRQWPGTFDSPDTQILARNLAGAGSALLIAVILKSLKKRVRKNSLLMKNSPLTLS